MTINKEWRGRNLIREIRAEQKAEQIKRMKADPTYRKLTVKHG